MFSPKNILVPTDFSEYSDAAFQKAVDIAAQYNSKIHLLHVIDELIQQCVADYCLDADIWNRLEKESLDASKNKLKQSIEVILQDKKIDIVVDVKYGHPPDEILNEETAKNIDLIVIASHGRRGILDHLMGSVANKVIKSSTCPVMVVKP